MTATAVRPEVVAAAPPANRRGPARSGLRRSESRWGVLMAAPAVIGFVVFTAVPMLASLGIGLTDWQIGASPHFAGTANFRAMITDPLLLSSLGATGGYAVLAVPAGILIAFLGALLLHQVRRARGVFRTVFYLPVLVPPVASAVLWLWMFNPDSGVLNAALSAVGLPTSSWIYGENTVIPSIALMTAWGFGNMALIFLAGLQGVPQELYEAAACDGAGAFRRLRHITLPQLSPVILFNLVTSLIGAFQVFDPAFVMTGGGPNNRSLFYVFYLYTQAFGEGRLGYASALAWVLFCLIAICTLALFRTAKVWLFYEGAKR